MSLTGELSHHYSGAAGAAAAAVAAAGRRLISIACRLAGWLVGYDEMPGKLDGEPMLPQSKATYGLQGLKRRNDVPGDTKQDTIRALCSCRGTLRDWGRAQRSEEVAVPE